MKFSIISACYNKAAFIKQTYKSVAVQTHADWEWLIIDDASKDSSWDKINRYAARDDRIRAVQSRNRRHCSGSYSRVFAMATGDVVGVLDMDDMLVPHALERMVALYTKYADLGYIYSQHEVVTRAKRHIRWGVSGLPTPHRSFAQMALKKIHCFSHFRTCRGGLVEPKVMFPAGLKSVVDKHMGLILEERAPGGFYPEVLYKYRYYLGDTISCKVNNSSGRDSQKKRWKAMAKQFIHNRSVNKTETFPVIQVSL